MNRFPGLRQRLGLDSGDDLRKKFFDQVLDHGDCKQLSYQADVQPWIGDNVALAAASFDKGAKARVSPLLALAVTDEDKARTGLTALLSCSSEGASKEAGFTFHDGFALISDTQAHAAAAARDAKSAPLTDDPGYRKWAGRLGDRGIANFYLAKAAAGHLSDLSRLGLTGDLPGGLPGGLPSGFATGLPDGLPSGFPSDFATGLPSGLPSELASLLPSGAGSLLTMTPQSAVGASAPYVGDQDQAGSPRTMLAKFTGAAGALRFADGGAELEVVGGLGTHQGSSDPRGALVTGLPSDTAAAAVAVPPGAATKLSDLLGGLGGTLVGGQLGISLPEDLKSLLGRGLALSLQGTPPADLSHLDLPKGLPAGLTIMGDPVKITAVIAKLEASQGGSLADSGITVDTSGDKVALSFDPGYAKALLGKGRLGDDKTFRQVVPEADRATAVGYVDFDSDWRAAIAEAMKSEGSSEGKSDGTSDGSKDFLANTGPLKALGFSSWSDGGVSHLLLKVTTD